MPESIVLHASMTTIIQSLGSALYAHYILFMYILLHLLQLFIHFTKRVKTSGHTILSLLF